MEVVMYGLENKHFNIHRTLKALVRHKFQSALLERWKSKCLSLTSSQCVSQNIKHIYVCLSVYFKINYPRKENVEQHTVFCYDPTKVAKPSLPFKEPASYLVRTWKCSRDLNRTALSHGSLELAGNTAPSSWPCTFSCLLLVGTFKCRKHSFTHHSGKDEISHHIVNTLESKENIIIYDTFIYRGPDCQVTASAANQKGTQLPGQTFLNTDDSWTGLPQDWVVTMKSTFTCIMQCCIFSR